MARFGEFKAQFFARGNLNTPLSDGTVNYRVPVNGTTEAATNGMGRTSLTFGYDALLNFLIAEGNVCICYQYDSLIADPYIGGTPFCLPFKIESVTPLGPGLIRIEGPDQLEELLDVQHFAPIGAGTETNTTVAVVVGDPAFTTLAQGAPHGNLSAALATSSGWEVGDEARITMDSGGVHVTTVWRVLPEADPFDHIIDFTDRLPGDAAAGNTVERRRRRVQVASNAAAFQVGNECRLTLDNATVHTTLIAEEPDGDIITMRDGAPDGAAVGKAVKATDFSRPTTSDVTKIMSYVSGWTVDFDGAYTGTEAGTHHAPNGDSVYDLLVTTAKATGEFFRLKTPGPGAAPKRTVVWKRGYDYAQQGGVNARLVQPTQGSIDAEVAYPGRGIITGDVEREGIFRPVTRVVPLAGDKRISLSMCSEEARLLAMVEGFTLVDSGLGLYTPPYVYDAAAEAALGMIARTVVFSQIRVETENVLEWQTSADQLMRAAIAYLYEHGRGVRYKFTVRDVVMAVPVQPGQRVEMVYTSPDGRWDVNATGGDALYVLEVRAQFDPPDEDADGNLNDRGKLVTLVLAESPWDIPDAATVTAAAIAEVGRVARVASKGGAAGATTIIMSGGGGGGSDHGELAGLADDDHPQYLRTDGTRALAGNLAANAGVTIDGVDISAHAANPAAHHAPVTASDGSITLSGQAVRVADAFAGAGLGLASGVLGVNAAAAQGTQIVTDFVGVLPAPTGGLQNTAAGVGLKLPANSGLLTDANGAALGTPLTLTAATANALSGAGHSHAVTATADAVSSGFNTLLKSGAAGEVALGRLGVGIATSTSAALYVRAMATDDYTLWLKQLTGQTADMWRVEDVAGNALIRLTGGGDLESGYPGFVSRVTGWQIEHGGNAEFNNVFIRGELHAVTFVADEMHATGGTLAVNTATKISVAINANDNVLPAVGSTFVLNTQASWDSGLAYFAVNDVLRWKSMGEIASGGSLDLYDIYLQVTAVGAVAGRNLANGNAGYSALTVRRLNGGATGFKIPAGSAVVKWAKIGGTGYTGNMLLTADLQYSPYLDIATIDATQSAATWQSAPVTPIPRVRVGNLRGVLGKSADEWGIAAGVNLSDTTSAARYLVASDQGLELRNVNINIYKSTERVFAVDYSAPSLALGNPLPTGTQTGGDGFWVGNAGAYHLRIGGTAATGAPQLLWDGSTKVLALRDKDGSQRIVLDAAGNSYFAGPMTLGAAGGIWQGTGTFDSPTTGLKLSRSGSAGVLAGYNGGTIQAAFDSDGKFKTGWNGTSWDVTLSSAGLALAAPDTAASMPMVDSTKRITWLYGATTVGWMAGRNISQNGWRGVELMADLTVGLRLFYDPSGGAVSSLDFQESLQIRAAESDGWIEFEAEARFEDAVIGNGATFETMQINDGLYAPQTIVLGATPVAISEQEAAVLALYSRTTHAPNPTASNITYLYAYRNTGTGKTELTLRGRTGNVVKIAEVAT